MINRARTSELQEDIGADVFDEVFTLFMSEMESGIQRLDNFQDDPQGMAEAVHFLKGAALNIGFQTLAELCQRLENSARNGVLAPDLRQQVNRCFDLSVRIYHQEVPSGLTG